MKKFIKDYFFLLIVCFFLLLTNACQVSNYKFKNRCYTSQYNHDKAISNIRIFHKNDSVSELQIQIEIDSLRIEKDVFTNKKFIRIKVEYVVYSDSSLNSIHDSNTSVVFMEVSANQSFVLSVLPLALKMNTDCILYYSLTDLNSHWQFKDFISADKQKFFGISDVKFYNSNGERCGFANFKSGEDVCFSAERFLIDSLKLQIFDLDRLFASPPYSCGRYDTMVLKEVGKILIADSSKLFCLHNLQKGIYHLSSSKGMFCFGVFDSDFPKYNLPSQLILPLRYIASNVEFDSLLLCKDYKNELDNFWLKISNDSILAKEHIMEYYIRVFVANQIFSSYKEGWKTDRGMIFIIFGKPKEINRYLNKEVWVYPNSFNFEPFIFTFIREKTNFGVEDYLLQRSIIYRPFWYIQIKNWRK